MQIHSTQKSDIDVVMAMEYDEENVRYITTNTKEEHEKLITDKNIKHLLLKTEESHIVGYIILAGLKNENRSIEFRRLVINEKGKGFGRLAVREIKKYCFETLGSHRLWLDVQETNTRATMLYRSEGFVEEGKLRDIIFRNNEFENLIVMSILESEYAKPING